jgi:Gp49-like protein DUF891
VGDDLLVYGLPADFSLPSCHDATLVDVQETPDGTQTLTFASRAEIVVFDDRAQYESYQIYGAERLVVVELNSVSEPYARRLGDKVPELRFHLLAQQPRITYWLAPGRRVILPTAFRKTRSAEVAYVSRALQAQKTCETDHEPAHDTFDREAS